MYQKLIDAIHRPLAEAGEVEGFKSKQLRYMIDAIVGEVLKTLILFFVFALFGIQWQFMMAFAALMMIRPMTGGLHFHSFSGCLVFTSIFFTVALGLFNFMPMTMLLALIITAGSALAILAIGPIQSKSRPQAGRRRNIAARIIGTIMIIIHCVLYMMFIDSPYLTLALWVFMLQSTQLIIAKGVNIYEKNVQNTSENIM